MYRPFFVAMIGAAFNLPPGPLFYAVLPPLVGPLVLLAVRPFTRGTDETVRRQEFRRYAFELRRDWVTYLLITPVFMLVGAIALLHI